jgi:putative transposase
MMGEVDHTPVTKASPPEGGGSCPWPHAPPHRLSVGGTFFITAGTYAKQHHFAGAERLSELQEELLKCFRESEWQIEAWAVFSNHYHCLTHSPPDASDASSLSPILQKVHSVTSHRVNQRDGTASRKVWHNYWETRLTHQTSYLARLNYTHQNPVRHGLVVVANQYPWCSASWFERVATPARVRTIYGFKTDRVRGLDEFEPAGDW